MDKQSCIENEVAYKSVENEQTSDVIHSNTGKSVKKKSTKSSKTITETKLSCSIDSKPRQKRIKPVKNEALSESPKIKKSHEKFKDEKPDKYSNLVKMNSQGNMRKLNKQSSVPNDYQVNSPIASSTPNKFDEKSPKLKSRSKTPECKGAYGKTPTKKLESSKRFIKFEPYIPLFQVQQGLKRGEFIEGALRINPRNYEDAYVSSPDGKMDIYIGGMQNRNRALNGDIVVVQINPKQEWKVLCDAIKDYQEKCETVTETICKPVLPLSPCKVHTPDPFVRPRPFSSNSWDNAYGQRSPDSLEILGINKFGSECSKKKSLVKGKSKHKNKKYVKEPNSQKSTTSYSQDSSEDCLDKVSPVNISDKESNVSEHCILGSSEQSKLYSGNNIQCVPESCLLENHNESLPTSSPHGTENFDSESENIQKYNNWCDNGNSDNLVVSPEELLHIEGDFLLNYSGSYENSENIIFDDDSVGNSDVDNNVVPPDDLSGDEFTDSASVASNEDLDQIIEDISFLSCQQDAENNNEPVYSQQFQVNTLNTQVSYQPSVNLTESTINVQCGVEFNKAFSSILSINEESDVACATLTNLLVKDHKGSSDENIQNIKSVSATKEHILFNINGTKSEKNKNNKNPRKRRRKKKTEPTHDIATNSPLNITNDVNSLTVEEIMTHPQWCNFIQKTGKVIHILEKKHSYLAAGHVKLFPDRNIKWALFSPNDSRIPRLMVPMTDCPQNFYHRPFDYSEVLFLAQIIQWNENSIYASGRLVRSLGNDGDVEAATEGILLENSVDYQDFNWKVLNCLPGNDWALPEEELLTRRDFRKECVFTIDPATARDVDDAVSCRKLDNGNFEVGVHIADVSYFVPEGSELDKDARSRSTSVYLVQKVIPMLPRRLCDDLCSLNPGKDKLTYSVVWEMSPGGNIVNQWIGRSVIKSCAKFSYEHVQDMIENPKRIWDKSEHPTIFGNFTIYDVIERVNSLHFIAVKLREKRFSEGALALNQVKLQFTLDSETGLPSGFNVFVQKDSNRLIEEFMLLANISVAKKIYDTFPELALLRRHPLPENKLMLDVISSCRSMGIHLDASSSGALQKSISQYEGESYRSKALCLALANLCAKPMRCALYFCSGVLNKESYRHYALNVPLYTHFTSPIRRYPDILVHRLLGAALNYNSLPNVRPEEMEKCALHCNDKKYNAKKVSDLSCELFLAVFINKLGSVHTKAIVTTVMDHSFDCLIIDMGIVKRAYCDKLPLLMKEFKRVNGVSELKLIWRDENNKEGVKQTIVMFAFVDIEVTASDSLQIKIALKKPMM